ncbi:hypothetical protein Glove_329g51 [Diversispora epigaea]|uniref:Uncharacterized protein n=1 Tax=Diversispora epigaea TaxID=1348612 RepID=A0A397HQF7_9GLOM|nr:hypothetical protein Glove_329g51 [Diversispora epigaea]
MQWREMVIASFGNVQPLVAFTMAIIVGLYVRHAINDSRRTSRIRQLSQEQLQQQQNNNNNNNSSSNLS